MSLSYSVVLSTVLGLCSLSLVATAQTIERVSVSSTGVQANAVCSAPRLSPDGRFVAFVSHASNLVAGDLNSRADVFVRDRLLQTTAIASVGSAGERTISHVASRVRLSNDGRYVLFLANALHPGDLDSALDLYRRDRVTGTTLALTTANDEQSYWAFDMSADGNVVAYQDGVPFGWSGVTIRKLSTGQTWTLVDVQMTATVDGRLHGAPAVSGDGRFVDFVRVDWLANNAGYSESLVRLDLASGSVSILRPDLHASTAAGTSFDGRYVVYTVYNPGVLSGETGLFWLDTQSGEHARVDRRLLPPPMFGGGGNGVSDVALSSNGLCVAFISDDSTMLPGDNNPWENAFVGVPRQRGTLRVDFDALGQDTSGESLGVALSGDGGLVAFSSWASTLISGDTNGVTDIFVRAVCGPHYADLDGDRFGDAVGAPTQFCLPAPAGWSVRPTDCDDANPAVNPDMPELCDGIDNNCDNLTDWLTGPFPGCFGGVNGTSTCTPVLQASGCCGLSAAAPSFVVQAVDLDPQRASVIFYGLSTIPQQPWGASGASYLCVGAPRQRTGVGNSGGAGPCSGVHSLDLAAWLAANPAALGSPFSAGEVLYLQGWFRDSAAPLGSSMTGSLQVHLAP